MKILVLNAGSSSQKSCLYNLEDALPDTPHEPIWEASIDWTHHDGVAEIKVKLQHGKVLEEEIAATSRAEIIAHMLKTLWSGEDPVLKSPSEDQGKAIPLGVHSLPAIHEKERPRRPIPGWDPG